MLQFERPGLPSLLGLTDIRLWEYGVALVVLAGIGLGAWLLHLRGARW